MEPSSGLEIKYKSCIRVEQDAGEVVTSIDLHPTEPWIMASFDNGMIRIWNYQTLTIFASSKRSSHSVFSAKFMPHKHWVVAAVDDVCIGFFNYRLEPFKSARQAHDKTIRCLAVHPTSPYALSSADDMLIKLWDLEKRNSRRFEGHSQPVVQVKFNPKDPNIFASASLDQTIKIWNIESSTPAYTVNTRSIVTCVDFFTAGDEPYFVTCSNDNTAKVWDYRTESLVSSVGTVTAVCFHPELPILITGSEDGDVSIWDSTTYGLEQSLLKGKELGKVWAIGCMKGTTRVFIFYSELIMMVKIGREEPAASMDNSGKVVWAKHKKIQTADISVESDHEVSDGESLRVEIEELSTCDFYTQAKLLRLGSSGGRTGVDTTRDATRDTCRIRVREIGSVVAVIGKILKLAGIFLQVADGCLQVDDEKLIHVNDLHRNMFIYAAYQDFEETRGGGEVKKRRKMTR